jgi:UDP-glucose 4-epimerase
MTQELFWVVGAGGMLGSTVERDLGGATWRPQGKFTWLDPARLQAEFEQAVAEFGRQAASPGASSWAIAWCAGAGVVATSQVALDAETAAFRGFLSLLGADPNLRGLRGHVMLGSSAGGVYGGSFDCPISEETSPQPISPYGRTKLLQEGILTSWALAQPRPIATLVARVSNVYGTAQRLDKPQGLISHMSRCLIHNAPIHIFVPLDTIRDYIFADDAGRRLANGLRRLVTESAFEPRQVMKIYGSERETSIAGLLGIFRQVVGRSPALVSGLSAVGALQPRRLQFRSRVWAPAAERPIELFEGVRRVYRHQLACFALGRLPAP